MPGMNNLSGKPVADIAHLSQSIADILTTPLGTRLERRTYGSVNEQNKLLINKVWDYRQNSPHLS